MSDDDQSSRTSETSSTAAAQLSWLPKLCRWCKKELEASRRVDAEFCSGACKQTAWRLRRRRNAFAGPNERCLTFAYADPPYPGLAARYYSDEPTYAGEVDHAELISRLSADAALSGWALSTSAAALRELLPLCPPGARVCPWVKPGGCPPETYGLHNRWEALIVVGGRMRKPGLRDWLLAQPARGGGELPGRKPLEFCVWLFELLGMLPGDTLLDLFPGTGVVGRSWHELSSAAAERNFNAQHDRAVSAAAVTARAETSSSTSRPFEASDVDARPVAPSGVQCTRNGSPAVDYGSIRG